VPSPQRIEFYEASIRDYLQVIETFETDRAGMLQRRTTANEKEAARLDAELQVNQRGLDLLREALAQITERLEKERSMDKSD